MKRIVLLLFLFAFAACKNLPTPDLVLRNVNIIDVKGIREMWGSPEIARQVREEIAADRLVGPWLVAAGN
ncbi:MAG: hypothetical protein ACE5GL_04155 [Calditrichia bacterium]